MLANTTFYFQTTIGVEKHKHDCNIFTYLDGIIGVVGLGLHPRSPHGSYAIVSLCQMLPSLTKLSLLIPPTLKHFLRYMQKDWTDTVFVC